jgi:plasmid maintenance system antidote protein VapI
MNMRIQQLIDELGLKKIEFAKKINVSPAFVSEMCSGRKNISDRTIIDICDKFHVNEDWLRSGEGEMFVARTREEEIAAFMGEVLDGPNNFKKRLISVLANLDEDGWELLEAMALKLAEEEAQGQK